MRARWSLWWFEAMPLARVAVFRTIAYSFIWVDVLLTTAWVARHTTVPGELYQPLFVGRLLHLPVPDATFIVGVEIALLVCAALAATGRSPRVLGIVVAVLYFEWMVIAMSYGKVDHDRFAFLVALAVLPTVGPARWRDHTPSEAAGWAIRAIQVAVVLTYFLAAFAKLRFGGLAWLDGATLMRAVIRRGTGIGDLLIHVPWLLHLGQYLLVGFELASPLLLIRGRVGRTYLALAIAFHIVTYATITIIFLPHVVCLLALMPLERTADGAAGRAAHSADRAGRVRMVPGRGFKNRR